MQEAKRNEGRGGAGAIALLSLLALAACANTEENHPQLDWPLTSQANHTDSTYYTVRVRPGDTLSELAHRYAVSTDAVAHMNGISNHNAIYVGEVLRIPAGSRATRDAVYADATSHPSRMNPYVPAPEPRRGGYPQASKSSVAIADLPPIASRPTNSPGKTLAGTPSRSKSPAWYTPVAQRSEQPQSQSNVLASAQAVQQQQVVFGSPRFVWPVSGHVVAEFGSIATGERNDGINIAAKFGDPIHAAASGTVTYAGNQLRGYGNLLLIKHDDGYITAYAHAQSILVQKGDRVLKGQVVGSVGQTGDVNEPQLHFEIRNGVTPVNPKPLLVASR
jgi:murein DD-endopeptidase MepM/ murein hydrolase activator NlpD